MNGVYLMAKINLVAMSVESLLLLRGEIDAKLTEYRLTLEREIQRLGGGSQSKSSLKGRKVSPKYRSRKDRNLTWAGRGATPLWMRNEMKAGKLKKEAFLIK